MNLHGTTEAEFAGEWQAGGSPMHSSMTNQSRYDGADPVQCREQASFESIFNALSNAAALTSIHGEIWLVHRAFTAPFGSHPQEAIGKPIDLFYADTADDAVSGDFQPHANTGDIAKPCEVRYGTKDRGTFIGETIVTAIKNGEGPVLGWSA